METVDFCPFFGLLGPFINRSHSLFDLLVISSSKKSKASLVYNFNYVYEMTMKYNFTCGKQRPHAKET